jgi:hypothetical protein
MINSAPSSSAPAVDWVAEVVEILENEAAPEADR